MSSSTLPLAGFSTVCFHIGGYAAYADPSEQVLTRCDQNLSDDREVIPITDGIKYPSLPKVLPFFLPYLVNLLLFIDH